MSAPDNRVLDTAELPSLLAGLDGWTHADGRLRRSYVFPDFPAALAFMVEVGFAAERLCHHPNWSNVYNRVEVELWSHDLGGVTTLCIELAEVMNRVAAR